MSEDVLDCKQTNADRIRSMSDEELAQFIESICPYHDEQFDEPMIAFLNENIEIRDSVHLARIF